MPDGAAMSEGWLGSLRLRFAKRDASTVLRECRHEGPLRLLKPHYSEGPGVCHAIVIHPPGGVVGGDRLRLEIACDDGARAQITTPGATKLYWSKGPESSIVTRTEVRRGACLEYVPLETIAFSGSRTKVRTEHRLHDDAVLFALDVVCFGRPMANERFDAGFVQQHTTIHRDERLLFVERMRVDGGGRMLASRVALDGRATSGALYVAARHLDAMHVTLAREAVADAPDTSVTLLPGVLVVRTLGELVEPVHARLERAYHALRPAVAGLAPHRPRIWNT